MTHRLFSLLSTLTVLGSGCALLGNRPADVPWSPSLVKALPTPPLYCFSQTVVGPLGFPLCFSCPCEAHHRADEHADDDGTGCELRLHGGSLEGRGPYRAERAPGTSSVRAEVPQQRFAVRHREIAPKRVTVAAKRRRHHPGSLLEAQELLERVE